MKLIGCDKVIYDEWKLDADVIAQRAGVLLDFM